jgi:hypothetical protein
MPKIKVSEKLERSCVIEITHTEFAMLLTGRHEVADEDFMREQKYARERVERLAREALDDTDVASKGMALSIDGRYL